MWSPKECPSCSGTLHPEVNLNCHCVCKECNEGERLCATSKVCLADDKWCDGIEHCLDDEVGCDVEEINTTPAYIPGNLYYNFIHFTICFLKSQQIKDFPLMGSFVLHQIVVLA